MREDGTMPRRNRRKKTKVKTYREQKHIKYYERGLAKYDDGIRIGELRAVGVYIR